MNPKAKRIQELLRSGGFDAQVLEMPDTTGTSADAARVIGTGISQICKSLIFRGQRSSASLLVLASGTNRVQESLIASYACEEIERADPEFVFAMSGFVIGGVPPLGHLTPPLRTYIDEDLLRYEIIWAAAGTPNAVFRCTPSDLKAMTSGEVVRVH